MLSIVGPRRSGSGCVNQACTVGACTGSEHFCHSTIYMLYLLFVLLVSTLHQPFHSSHEFMLFLG
jgi:hypothetical protein